MLRAGSKSLQSCSLTAGGANVSEKLPVAENLDRIGAEEYRCQKEEVQRILWAPRAPEKKLKTKLACDAGKSVPDLAPGLLSPLISFSRAQPTSHGENQPGLCGFSSVIPAPQDGHNLCGFSFPLWSLLCSGQVHTHAQNRQMPPGKKISRDQLA